MAIAFRTPVVIVLGRVGNELATWSANEGVSVLGNVLGIELLEELKVEKQITGHLAIASFGQYIIKAVDMGSRYGSYTLSGDALVRIPSRGNVDLKRYNDWFTIRNTFILIGDPASGYVNDYYPIICPYRVGDTLFINTGYTSASNVRVILTILGLLRNYASGGSISTTCMCRIPSMPLEVALIISNKYLLFRTYMNEARTTPGNKYLVLLTKGGNVVSKYSTSNEPLNLVTNLLNEIRNL